MEQKGRLIGAAIERGDDDAKMMRPLAPTACMAVFGSAKRKA
jgi:hypothetical protein